ncbi:MAG: M28 family metallopeptidase [Acidobacteria bacterium]|nr:M28 family metallopeptidase [Acidobacteriota bacterium]
MPGPVVRVLLVVWLAAAVCVPHVRGQAPGGGQAPTVDQRITQLLEQVSEARLIGILKKLGSFETRNTLSSTDSPTKGIGAARQWILDEMTKSSPRLQVSFDSYAAPQAGRITREVELRNVMAVLPGKSPRRIYISAHYDTFARRPAPTGQARPAAGSAPPRAAAAPATPAAQAQAPASDNDNSAPGVNDDGSGTALVMELARVCAGSGIEFDATLVFIALVAEEQGLVGARMHAQKAVADKVVIDAVLNNDMVGNVEAGNGLVDAESVRVFSEGPEDSPSRQLARYVQRTASLFVPSQQIRLMARYDRFGRGGDHTPFNQAGFTAIRITEANENFERQHTTADTFEGMSIPYFLRNVKVNLAVAASLALAPPAPVVMEKNQPMLGRQPSGYDANLHWLPSPGAAGYRIYWREAWTPDWQHEQHVGNVTQFVLPGLSIDDYVFGVAAVGPGGHESLVSAYVNPPRSR